MEPASWCFKLLPFVIVQKMTFYSKKPKTGQQPKSCFWCIGFHEFWNAQLAGNKHQIKHSVIWLIAVTQGAPVFPILWPEPLVQIGHCDPGCPSLPYTLTRASCANRSLWPRVPQPSLLILWLEPFVQIGFYYPRCPSLPYILTRAFCVNEHQWNNWESAASHKSNRAEQVSESPPHSPKKRMKKVITFQDRS